MADADILAQNGDLRVDRLPVRFLRTPVVVHLLAPNQRAVQTTTDLAGFWQRLYPAVRKELMRRYPRHPWPEKVE